MFKIEDVEYYEMYKNDEKISERMGLEWELEQREISFKERHGANMTLCYKCLMPIDIEQEKEELMKEGKEFRSYCMDCEKEMELEINEEVIIEENSLDETMEVVTLEKETNVRKVSQKHVILHKQRKQYI